jgi:hypothetical protein
MTGDADDMMQRLKALLPPRWFPDETPVLDGFLAGLANTAAWAYSLVQSAGLQTRLATASGAFLDMIAQDFFGARLARGVAQGDDAFRALIGRELLRERGTRPALIQVLTDLTGRVPVVFEPARPADTGSWNLAAGYGAAGAWGSLMLPFQCFVTAYRPAGLGIAVVNGWCQGAGGYGGGAIEYAALSMVEGQVTDADINAAIAGVMPVSSIAWTRIDN